MPATATFMQRTISAVKKSVVKTSAIATVSAVKRSFAARDRTSTLVGGAIVPAVTLSLSSFTLGSTLGTKQLTVTVVNAAGDRTFDPVVWSSDTPSHATVSQSGLVTGVATGAANITATAGGVTSSACAITVP